MQAGECGMERIVSYLEEEILSGRLAPLSKLPSSRKLAEHFSVSQPLVIKAARELEKRRLVFGRERKGLFVSATATLPEILEVLIFTFEGTIDNSEFVRRVTSFYDSPSAVGKMNFQIRSVNLPRGGKTDPAFRLAVLRGEVARLSRCHCDCAVLAGPTFGREDIDLCAALPFPALFLGDFRTGDFEGLSYNHLGFRSDYFRTARLRAEEIGARRIVTVMPQDGKELPEYVREPLRAFHEYTESQKLESCFFTVENPNSDDPETRKKQRKTLFDALRSLKPVDCEVIHFMFGTHCGEWAEAFQKSAFPAVERKHEVIFASSKETLSGYPGIFQEFVAPEEQDRLQEYQCSVIRRLAAGTLKNFRDNFSVEFNLR